MLLLVVFAALVLYPPWQLQPGRMERQEPNAWVGMPVTVDRFITCRVGGCT